MPKADSAASALPSLLDGRTDGVLISELTLHSCNSFRGGGCRCVLGADRHKSNEERSGYRYGSRQPLLTTKVGDITLSIPKLRAGCFSPTILEIQRRIYQAVYAVIVWTGARGVSTPKVDALVATIGSDPGSRAKRSASSGSGLDTQIQTFA